MRKKLTSVVLIFCILALCAIPGFASGNRTSHVEFYGSHDSLYAKAFVTGTWKTEDSFLVIAVYADNGNIADFAISEVNKNTIITAGPVDSSKGTVTKAFVWQKSTNMPLSKISTYNAGENEVFADTKILFDGLTLSEYSGGALDFSGSVTEYDIDMKEAQKNKLPVVSATCGDNSAEVSVNTDSEAYKTTVTVSYGTRTALTSDISEYLSDYSGNDKNLYTYSKNSRTYTFNYKNIQKITDYIAFNGTSNYGFYNDYAQKYLYSKAYKLSEDETYKKVNISFEDTSNIYNTISLFIIPKDLQYKGSVVAVPITDEKTGKVTGVKAPELADDLAISHGKNSDGTFIYGKRSVEKIVSVSSTNASETHTGRLGYVRYNYRKYDPENFVTGALVRSPSDITTDVMEYTANHGFVRRINGNEADAAFLGCEYIPVWATSGPNKKQLTLEFYISKDATVAIYSSVKTLGINFDDSETNASCTTQTVYPIYSYGNQISATGTVLSADPARLNLIKAIFKYYGNFDLDKDIVVTSSGVIPSRFNTYFSFDVEGQTCDAATIRKACLTDIDGNFVANDPRLYESDGTTAKTVDEIIELFKGDPTNNFINITYVNPQIKKDAHKPMPVYYDGASSVFTDLTEGNEGKPKSHDGIFELNGSHMILGAYNWYNTYHAYGNNTSAKDYSTDNTYKKDIWYSFNTNQPAQVFVFANTNAETLIEDATYWNEVSVGDNAPEILMDNNAEEFDSVYMYCAKAGENINIVTPGSDVKFIVMLKPAKIESAKSIDGKKFLFIGNSFTYYGKCVLNKSDLTLDARAKDKGYFYQLCKENGAEVSVTNWTFGGHTLADTFRGSCAANRGHDGYDHLAQLTDRYYDYVMIQPGSKEDGTFMEDAKYIMDIFRKENPNVKFFCLVPRFAHTTPLPEILNNLKNLEAMGVAIVDWPELVSDIIDGNTVIPDSDITYNKNTFIISKSVSDGYHPNMLTGYITALMTYSAVTGEFAKGQPYEFCTDTSVNAEFSVDRYLSNYYTYGDTSTTFPDVFKSEHDMLEIQKLIDKYLKQKSYREYNYEE